MRVQNEHVPELSHVSRAGSRERDQETNKLKGRKGKKTDIAKVDYIGTVGGRVV